MNRLLWLTVFREGINKMKVIGIDEAGRGPVLGPVVVGMVAWDERWNPQDPPLRDSKRLSPKQREQLFTWITERGEYRILAVPAWVITQVSDSLPWLEARVIASALDDLPEDSVFCDRLSAGERVHDWIAKQFSDREFCFETGADDRYPAVSAASILAKVTRDRILEHRERDWGELGSGYPSDPVTKAWLGDRVSNENPWPSFVRTEWSTVKTLEKEYNQLSWEESGEGF